MKPGVPHPGFLPTVISWRPEIPLPYNMGFKKPNGGRLFARRASFSKVITAAKVGADAEVPSTVVLLPLTQTV